MRLRDDGWSHIDFELQLMLQWIARLPRNPQAITLRHEHIDEISADFALVIVTNIDAMLTDCR